MNVSLSVKRIIFNKKEEGEEEEEEQTFCHLCHLITDMFTHIDIFSMRTLYPGNLKHD